VRVKSFLAALVALVLFLLIGCILDSRRAGRGSEVENEVAGTLVNESGKPVANARVLALPSSPGDTDTVKTDIQGRYAFDSLPVGDYNFLGDANSGSLVVLIPDVKISRSDSGTDLGIDTLRAPGGIRGRLLAGSRGMSGVLCFAPGLSRLDVSDDSGRFLLSGLPQGKYSVRYSSTGFIIAPDSNVQVRAGLITELPDKQMQYDPAQPPPEPIGLRATYDTLLERVNLTWDIVPVSDLDGFIIYRDNPDFLAPEIVPGGFTKSAVFTDTSLGDLASGYKTFVYRLKARDKGLNLSINYSDPVVVEAVPRSLVTTTSSLEEIGSPTGLATPGDSILLAVRFENPNRNIQEIQWSREGDPAPLKVSHGSWRGGADTLLWVAGTPGVETFTVRMLDDAGHEWTVARAVTTVLDAPQADAGPDQTVSLGDTVKLRGTGKDGLGHIEKYAWSIGGAVFSPVQAGETEFIAPQQAGPLLCVLQVTDDDGNAALDTLIVTVAADPPRANAGKDTTVSIGDRINLHGSGADRFGSIVKWEWELDGAPVTDASGPDYAFTAPGVPRQAFRCVLRATDDDGQVGSDTLFVSVVLDAPVAQAGPDTLVSVNDSIILAGKAVDGFGSISKYEWQCGSEPFVAGPPVVKRKVPDLPTPAFVCVLRVTDDDGNVATDTMRAAVISDLPVAKLSADAGEEGFTDDTVALSAKGSADRFGKIVAYAWDFGGSGDFRFSSGADTSFMLPPTAGLKTKVVLKVKDDDGGESLDSLSFSAHARGGTEWLSAGDQPADFQRYLANALSFDNKLWMLGGSGPTGSLTAAAQIRYSSDGRVWTRSPGDAPFDQYSKAIGYAGKIWALGAGIPKKMWNTSDGINWVAAPTPALPTVDGEALAVFDGKLWVIGGRGVSGGWDKEYSDVWSYDASAGWVQETASGAFPGRYSHCAFSINGMLFVTGGFTNDGAGGAFAGLADMWSSTNGKDWTYVRDQTGTSGRVEQTAVAYAGKIWLIGGRGYDNVAFKDVWTSVNGTDWVQATADGLVDGGAGAAAASFGGKVWLLGGRSSTGGFDSYLYRQVRFTK
jgi:hypothetical protein